MSLKIIHIRELLARAELAGVPTMTIRAAAAEITALIELAIAADSRRLETLRRAKAIENYRARALKRAEICALLAISRDQYVRATRVWRDSRPLSVRTSGRARKESPA